MTTKLYFLDDTSSHVVTSEHFQEICDMALGVEPATYMVMATVDLDRDDPGYIHEGTFCEVRLEVFSGLGALLGSDQQQFKLSAVVGPPDSYTFDRDPSSRHASLMVTAAVPSEGDAGRDTSLTFTTGEPENSHMALLVPSPRAVLSAGRLTALEPELRVALSNIRIVAFKADEVVVKHL